MSTHQIAIATGIGLDKIAAVITNEHAACSYGRPLVVVDGKPHTIGDMLAALGLPSQADLVMGPVMAVLRRDNEALPMIAEWLCGYEADSGLID